MSALKAFFIHYHLNFLYSFLYLVMFWAFAARLSALLCWASVDYVFLICLCCMCFLETVQWALWATLRNGIIYIFLPSSRIEVPLKYSGLWNILWVNSCWKIQITLWFECMRRFNVQYPVVFNSVLFFEKNSPHSRFWLMLHLMYECGL